MDNNDEKKLGWMYKSATSLVDREEYLLGRTVDKSLEQINAEEKEKKFVLPTPKNHVEHECIPPSIRDFNKIVQAEQVDLSAKLQEDPLVAIKKREEEARRQFLQNPVQLKKLQEALKAQQQKRKKKKHKHSKNSGSDSDLDNKIAEKLRLLKSNPSSAGISKKLKNKSKESSLDTILMHKFNALKDQLSEKDLKDILNGNISDSEDEEIKKRNSSSSEDERKSKIKLNKKRNNSSSSESKEENKSKIKRKYPLSKREKYRYKSSSSEESDHEKLRHRSNDNKDRRNTGENNRENRKSRGKYKKQDDHTKKAKDKYKKPKQYEEEREDKKEESSDSELERKITEKLRILRGEDLNENKSPEKMIYPQKPIHLKRSHSTSSEESDTRRQHDHDSDSDNQKPKSKAFGLTTSDGKQIALKRTEVPKKVEKSFSSSKVENTYRPDINRAKKLTEKQKEHLRREMMQNAEKRDKEREVNIRKYKEKDKKEEETFRKEYNTEFLHKELIKSAKNSSVETRIKSNLNNIQRSSRHMDSNFLKR